MDLSVVILVFNEQDSLLPLHEELNRALRPLGLSYEMLFVDDGSTDASAAVLRQLCAERPHLPGPAAGAQHRSDGGPGLRVAQLARRGGGRIDGDGENDPADIPRLLAKLDEGYDLVSGWRQERWKGSPLTRRLPSMAANALISRMTGTRPA